jgi:hypothetical protein
VRDDASLAAVACGLGALIAAARPSPGTPRAEAGVALTSDWVHVARSLRLGGWTGVPVDRPVASSKRGALAIHGEGAAPRFSALGCRLHCGTPNSGCHQRFLSEVGSLRGLWETNVRPTLARQGGHSSYRMLALGAFNNRVFRPAPSSQDCLRARTRRFLVSIAVELTLGVVIVGVYGGTRRRATGKGANWPGRPVPSHVTCSCHPNQVNVVVDPGRTGSNSAPRPCARPSHRPARERLAEIRVNASLPAAGIGPLRLRAVPAGPGHAVVPRGDVSSRGRWTLRLDIRRGEFDEESTQVIVPIRKDSDT